MKKLIAVLIMAVAPVAAFASGSWSSVTVADVYAYSTLGVSPNGQIQIKLSSNSTGGPSCASSYLNYVVIDPSTNAGAALAGIFMRALSLGLSVSIAGTGTCTINSSIESVDHVTITN